MLHALRDRKNRIIKQLWLRVWTNAKSSKHLDIHVQLRVIGSKRRHDIAQKLDSPAGGVESVAGMIMMSGGSRAEFTLFQCCWWNYVETGSYLLVSLHVESTRISMWMRRNIDERLFPAMIDVDICVLCVGIGFDGGRGWAVFSSFFRFSLANVCPPPRCYSWDGEHRESMRDGKMSFTNYLMVILWILCA